MLPRNSLRGNNIVTGPLLKTPVLNQYSACSVQENIEPTKSNMFTSAVRILIMQGACLDNGSPLYCLLEARLIIFSLIRFASPKRELASPDAQISFAVVCLRGPLYATTKKQTTQITSDHEKQCKHLKENTQHLRPGMEDI